MTEPLMITHSLETLGLSHMKPIQRQGRVAVLQDHLEKARDWIRTHAPGDLLRLNQYTRQVVWLAPRNPSEKSIFASCTLADERGTTFLTPLALRYLPPHSVIEHGHPYPLAENLIHESIHQQLYEEFEQGEILSESARGESGPKIQIDWRSTVWTLEKSFHACVVYRNAERLRKIANRYSDQEVGQSLSDATLSAKNAADTLSSQIKEHARYFRTGALAQWGIE